MISVVDDLNLKSQDVFMYSADGDECLINRARDLLPPAADQYLAEHKASVNTANELPELRFFYEGPEVCDVNL